MKYNTVKNYDGYNTKHKSGDKGLDEGDSKNSMQMFGCDYKNFSEVNDIYKGCCVSNGDGYSRDAGDSFKIQNFSNNENFGSHEGIDGYVHYNERFDPKLRYNNSYKIQSAPIFRNDDVGNSFTKYVVSPAEYQHFDRGINNHVHRIPSYFNNDLNVTGSNTNGLYHPNMNYFENRNPIPLKYAEYPDDYLEHNGKNRGVYNIYSSYVEKANDDYEKENVENVCTYDSNKYKKRNRVRINDRYVVRGQSYYEKNGKLYKIFKCEYPGCLKEYTNQYSLKYHMEKGHAEEKLDINKPFVCKYGGCFKRYKNKSTLVYHLKNVHKLKNGY